MKRPRAEDSQVADEASSRPRHADDACSWDDLAKSATQSDVWPLFECLPHKGGVYRSYALRDGGRTKVYDALELRVSRIVSRRRFQRYAAGCIGACGTSSDFVFANGDLTVESVDCAANGLAPQRVEVLLVGDDAAIGHEGEGALEPDELRLLASAVGPRQRLLLDEGGEVLTADGDIELYNAFRPLPQGRPLSCLLRWTPDTELD
eukprot:CAMPEP_0115856622 /NCGR_PEP_ID=MMETSP0287-20121206/15150_1 /TAXON_ID=412157 /ORGANISM="Chrysochromulina rotalis, Strain UIO044" /LENGTH=205 /DNA_ID=CAMNT_0003310807 /DNA_START=108 /DNA_END=725 /DNA_ORIENTATION=-